MAYGYDYVMCENGIFICFAQWLLFYQAHTPLSVIVSSLNAWTICMLIGRCCTKSFTHGKAYNIPTTCTEMQFFLHFYKQSRGHNTCRNESLLIMQHKKSLHSCNDSVMLDDWMMNGITGGVSHKRSIWARKRCFSSMLSLPYSSWHATE